MKHKIILLFLLGVFLLNAVSSFELGVKYQDNYICSPNSLTCQDSKTLKNCSENGTTFELTKCEGLCKVDENGTASCLPKTESSNNTILWGVIIVLVIALVLSLLRRKRR